MNARLMAIVTAGPTVSTATTAHPALAHESFVIPHDQLRFQLLHGVHGNTHDDQQRSAAEIKLHAKSIEHEAPHMTIEPVARRANGKCCKWIPEIIHSGSRQTIAR